MNLQSNNISLKLNTSNLPQKSKTSINESVVTYGGKIDYETNVTNKPTFNGKELVGNVEEEDPSMVAIDLEDLSNMFNSIFK